MDESGAPLEGGQAPGAFKAFEPLPAEATINQSQLVANFNGTYDGHMAVRVGFAEDTAALDYTGEPIPVTMRQVDILTDLEAQQASFEGAPLILGSAAGVRGENSSRWGQVQQGEFVPVNAERQKRLDEIAANTAAEFRKYRAEQLGLGSVDFHAYVARKQGVDPHGIQQENGEWKPIGPQVNLKYVEDYSNITLQRKPQSEAV